jgi:hypothetical protein
LHRISQRQKNQRPASTNGVDIESTLRARDVEDGMASVIHLRHRWHEESDSIIKVFGIHNYFNLMTMWLACLEFVIVRREYIKKP